MGYKIDSISNNFWILYIGEHCLKSLTLLLLIYVHNGSCTLRSVDFVVNLFRPKFEEA